MKRERPSPELLRQLLEYDPKSGVLTWRARQGKFSSRWNARFAGTVAGTAHPDGYIHVKVHNRSVLAHRIIWAMVYDCWPECIDHKNGRPSDNRLKNLRAVSRKINQRNQRRHSSNTSGRTGVHWNRTRSLWVAQIKMAGRSIYLGGFEDKEAAVRARVRAEKKYGFTGRL